MESKFNFGDFIKTIYDHISLEPVIFFIFDLAGPIDRRRRDDIRNENLVPRRALDYLLGNGLDLNTNHLCYHQTS